MESLQFLEGDQSSLHRCLSRLFCKDGFEIVDYAVIPLNKSVNFTTAGIFKIQGNAKVGYQVHEWSIVLKVIKPDSKEKDDPSHHNYWKREAQIHSSGLLSKLPSVITFPQCYLVEEKTDGTVWLWMDEVKDDNNRHFSQDEWAFISRQVGFLNGVYLSEMPLPDEPWICRQWLRSWVDGCKKYAVDPVQYYGTIQNRFSRIDSLWIRFLRFEGNMDKHISALSQLPRVLAHQDLSKANMYISNTEQGPKLMLIDWQFMSISGLGEDLGKLYGSAMSQGNIPRDSYEVYKELLFQNYLEGLANAGWRGDVTEPRYGFCVSLASRSAWEVPRLMKKIIDSGTGEISDEAVDLIRINEIHVDCAEEADSLFSLLRRS